MTDPTDFLSIGQAAKFLEVDRSTIWRWVQNKKLKPTMIAGKTVFAREDIDKLKKEKGA